jgi:hypothetical protein
MKISTDKAIAILEEKGLFDPVTRDRIRFVLDRIGAKVVEVIDYKSKQGGFSV